MKSRITVRYMRRLAASLTHDLDLQEDLLQEAQIELLGLPDNKPEGYYRRALKFHLLNYLRSYSTGNWWVGRNGKDPRYIRLDLLTGLQIDTEGRLYGKESIFAHLNFNNLEEYKEDEYSTYGVY